ncbi:MAG: beta-propeller fold lactonase family protein [Cyanobacteria bacterium P01_D01_bin.115]
MPQAQYIVALSDVDMVGTAYEDGLLGPVVARPDTLSLFRPGQEEAFSTVAASNSVFSPPSVLDISPDGRFAAVVETLQPRPEGATTLAELEAVPGDLLQIFDLRDPAAPSLISSTAVPVRPSAVHFNYRGDLLAIVGLAADNGLTLVPFDQGMLGEPQTFSLGLVTRDDIPFDPVHNVRFHPSQDLLAVNLTLRNQVIFFQVDRSPEGSVTGIQQWGNIVAVNRFPVVGKFTSDGRYYITSDLMWGPEVPRFYGYQGQGTLTTIAVGLPSTATDVVQNQLVAVTPGGFQSETLAISEDGTLLALSNMRTTGLPRDSELFDPNASISLYRIDLSSGALTKLDEVTFEALLPQGLAFDPSGQQLYVGVNEYFDGETTSSEGGVEVWDIVDQSHLERTNKRYRAPRGVHVVQTLS